MPDGDGTDAPLGLHRLARVVDDEGIDDRHGAEQRLRRAGVGQRQRLARQPFERAVRAEMHERMNAEPFAQMQVERHIRVTRRAGEIVIAGFVSSFRAAVRLQCHEHIARLKNRNAEASVAERRVILRRAPRSVDGVTRLARQRVQP